MCGCVGSQGEGSEAVAELLCTSLLLSEMEHRTAGTIRLTYNLCISHNISWSGRGTKGRSKLMAFADGARLGSTSSTEGYLYFWMIWVTLSAGTSERRWNLIVESTRSCAWEVWTGISAASLLEMTEEEKNLGVFADLKMTENSRDEAVWQKARINWAVSKGRGRYQYHDTKLYCNLLWN